VELGLKLEEFCLELFNGIMFEELEGKLLLKIFLKLHRLKRKL
jgi:hypothetical protein